MRNQSRPVLYLPRTPLETLLEVLTVLGLISVIALTIWGWQTLPARIPTHFGLSGTPNAFGSKVTLLMLPIISICLAVLFFFVSRSPHRYNYPWPITRENAARQYSLARLLICWLALEIVLMFCGLQWIMIQAAQSQAGIAFLLVVPVVVFILLVTIIFYVRVASRAR